MCGREGGRRSAVCITGAWATVIGGLIMWFCVVPQFPAGRLNPKNWMLSRVHRQIVD